jgi:uncharacterized protein with NRDE domain
MCLLTVLFGVHPEAPVVVGANRDERYARATEPVQLLRSVAPRTLGGRDVLAGGTWLAVNEHGVYAGITNRPSAAGRDPARRSRGELPLLLTEHPSAERAIAALRAKVCCPDYNACWLLVGDREALFYVAIGDDEQPGITELSPGVHVLENRPLTTFSAKAEMVRGALGPAATWRGPQLVKALHAVLASHDQPSPHLVGREATEPARRAELKAACVHTADYGTRSSTVITLAADPGRPPRVHYADGAPCASPLEDVSRVLGAPGGSRGPLRE